MREAAAAMKAPSAKEASGRVVTAEKGAAQAAAEAVMARAVAMGMAEATRVDWAEEAAMVATTTVLASSLASGGSAPSLR